MLHDGYTDQLYALLPVWQSQFGLSYADLALRAALTLATFLAAEGFLLTSLPFGFPGLCAGLVLAGI